MEAAKTHLEMASEYERHNDKKRRNQSLESAKKLLIKAAPGFNSGNFENCFKGISCYYMAGMCCVLSKDPVGAKVLYQKASNYLKQAVEKEIESRFRREYGNQLYSHSSSFILGGLTLAGLAAAASPFIIVPIIAVSGLGVTYTVKERKTIKNNVRSKIYSMKVKEYDYTVKELIDALPSPN